MDTSDGTLERWASRYEGAIDADGVRLLLELAREEPGLTGPGELTPDRLRRLMLRTFPEAVVAETEDVPSVMATARALVDLLADTAGLPSGRAADLHAELTALEPELTRVIGELDAAERESAGEVVRGMMLADGVDLDDEDAVQGWLGGFESLSEAERFDRAAAYLRESEEMTVPPVELAPVAELAEAARRSGLTRRVLALAEWAGERAVGEAGEPLPEDAAAVASVVEPSETGRLWWAAVEAGVLAVGNGRVAPGPALKDLSEGDDASVLAAWLRLFDAAVAGSDQPGQDADPAALVRAELTGVLIHLYEQDTPGTREELAAALAGHLLDTRMDHGATPPPAGVAEALGRELDELAAWGVVTEDEGPELTPLGVWGVRELLVADGFTAPVVGGLAARPAAELVSGLQGYDERTAALEMERWVAAREPGAAAGELIQVMRAGGPGERNVADAVLNTVDADAAPVVREALDDPATRPYAMLWLHERGLAADELGVAEMTWVLADTVAALMEITEPGEAVAEALTDVPPGAGLIGLIEGMADTGHPRAAEVLDALGAHLADPALAGAARAGALRARSR